MGNLDKRMFYLGCLDIALALLVLDHLAELSVVEFVISAGVKLVKSHPHLEMQSAVMRLI